MQSLGIFSKVISACYIMPLISLFRKPMLVGIHTHPLLALALLSSLSPLATTFLPSELITDTLSPNSENSLVSGCTCSPLVSGFPLNSPRRTASSVCCSIVITCARKNTTPRWDIRIARSRIKASEASKDISCTEEGNSVPITGVDDMYGYEVRELVESGGVRFLF